MSKYLNVFNTLAEYQAFSASTEYVQPNVALVKETNVLYYDYGDNKPQADQSDFKVESEEISVGGDKYCKSAIIKVNYIPSGITDLRDAFNGFTSIVTAPEIPSSVTSLYGTFYGCTSLVNAPVIPSGVTSMNSTFANCKSLVNAPEMPDSVTDVGSTFNGCSSLVNVPNISSGVWYMGYTFNGCTSLVTAPAIPSGVNEMQYTFQYCYSLKEVTLLPTTPPKYYVALLRCPIESIYVPDESLEDYRTATGWSEFADKFKPLSSKPTE